MKVTGYYKGDKLFWHFGSGRKKKAIIENEVLIKWCNRYFNYDPIWQCHDGVIRQFHSDAFIKEILGG